MPNQTPNTSAAPRADDPLGSPQGAIPFTATASQVRDEIAPWFSRQALTPSDFTADAAVTGVTRAYMPFWLARARVFCPWTALSGTFIGRSSGGDDDSREMLWDSASGVVEQVLDDVLVQATTAVEIKVVDAIRPWPVDELQPLDGRPVEEPILPVEPVSAEEVTRRARAQMHQRLKHLCRHEVPGDRHRLLRITPEYSEESAKLVLVPVWMAPYTYRGRTFPIVANGCTGTVAGEAPVSRWKFTLTMLILLGIAGGFVYLMWKLITDARQES